MVTRLLRLQSLLEEAYRIISKMSKAKKEAVNEILFL